MSIVDYLRSVYSRSLAAVVVFTLSLAIVSCGSGPEGADTEDDESIPEIEITEMDNPEDNAFLYTLPSPLQIASIFRRSGLTYMPDITNDANSVSNYNTKFIQKLNFGVYATDLAYNALNNQNQACIDYVKAMSELSEKLWMTNIFTSVSILERFEQNMGDPDSLGYIIADFQMELDSYLEENGLSGNSIVIFAGAWIESMYIGFKAIEADPETKLLGRIVEQRKIADDLIELLGNEEGGADMTVLLEHLQKISTHFAEFNIDEMESEEDLENLKMTEEQIDAVLADITAARDFIIKG